jgi:plasmid stabilization system protein ParE
LYQVVYSPRAEAQLTELLAQIALAASPEIAARYVDAIVAQCDSLSTFPRRGTRRGDLWPGLRVVGFRRRVSIAFVIEKNMVIIHGIFYGGQNLEGAFEDEH